MREKQRLLVKKSSPAQYYFHKLSLNGLRTYKRNIAEGSQTKRYSVQEVVEMIGHNGIPTFCKHFVDAFGTTPSTYE